MTGAPSLLARVFSDLAKAVSAQDALQGPTTLTDGTGPGTMVCGIPFRRLAGAIAGITADPEAPTVVMWLPRLLEHVFSAGAEDDPRQLRAHVLQAAATAIRWVEDLDRRTAAVGPVLEAPTWPVDGPDATATLEAWLTAHMQAADHLPVRRAVAPGPVLTVGHLRTLRRELDDLARLRDAAAAAYRAQAGQLAGT